LEDGYEKRRMWDELIGIKRRLVELTYDPAVQASLLREAADVAATRKRDLPLSVELWNDVLGVVPGDPDALAALEQIYERDKQWEELADVLQQRVELLTDPTERSAALLKLGMVTGDKLEQVERSLDAWSSLLALEPDNFRARDAVRKALVELERWDELEEFYGSDGSWAEYVRQIESLAGSVDGDELRIDLLRRAARVWSDELEDEGRAVKNLEKILSIDADDAPAATKLAPHYRERGDFKRLAPVLEVLLGHAETNGDRYAIRVELARGHVDKLRDAGGAVHWFGEALGEEPWHIEILDELEAASTSAEAPNELESILEDARSALSTMPEHDDAWLNLSLRMGSLLDASLGRPEDALVYYDDVLIRVPDNSAALDAKDQIFTRLARWDDLLDVIASKMDRVETPAERIALLERMSIIHEDSRDDFSSAIVTWNEILAIDPEREAAFSSLHRLYRSTDDFDALAGLLRQQLELHPRAVDESRWLDQVLALAEVLVEPLQQYDEALGLLEQAVTAAPSNGKARELLENVLADPDQEVRAAGILAPLYEAEESWAGYVGMLEIQASALDDSADKTGILRRLGHVQERQLSDPVKASDAYARLLRADAMDEEASGSLESLAGQIDGWGFVVSLYEELADEIAFGSSESAGRSVDLLTRAARFSDDELGDLDESIRLSRRVLELAPGHPATLVRLDDLLARGGRYDELLTNCQDRLALTEDPTERRALLLQSAQLHETQLDDAPSAIDAYQQILGLDGTDAEALTALDRLYGQTGDAMNQAVILEGRATLEEDGTEAQLDLLNRLADIQEDDLGDVAASIEVRRRVLGAAPDNGPAQARLEALLETEDYATQAASILEPIYVAHNDNESLVRLLEVMLTSQVDPAQRRETFARLIELQRVSLDDRAAAYEVTERALVEFLGDRQFTDTALQLAESLDAWSALTGHLEALADDAMDPATQRNTLALVAGLRDTRMGDVESAVGLWERVVDANPQDMEALEALEALHTRTEAWAPLVETLLRKTEHPDVFADQQLRLGLMFRAASLYEDRLDDAPEAINLLLSVLSFDPTNSGAIEQLERLYTRTGAWEDLVENYHRKLAMTEDADERRELHFAMGRVLESELDDPDRAIEAYRTIVAEKPDDLGALSALDRLYVQTENWHELHEILRAEAGIVDDIVQAHALKIRIGQLQESELMMSLDAVATYGEVLGEDVSNYEARAALMGLARRGEETAAVYRLLEPIYRTEGAWDELIELNGRLVEVTDLSESRRALFADAARIHENQLGSQSDAWSSWANVIREGLRLQDIEQICRLAEPLESWAETIELLEEMWDQESDPVLRTAVGLRIAAAWRDKLGSSEKAIEAYTRVYDEDINETSALYALDGLYSATEQWGMLSEVLSKRIMAPDVTPSDATVLRLRLASLYLDALDSPMDAVSTYREVLIAEPENESAIGALEELAKDGVETTEIAMILEPQFRASQSWSRLVELHQARIRQEDSNDERYRLWLEVASVYEQELSDPTATLVAVGSALVEMPSDAVLKDRLQTLAESTGEWSAVADIYENLLRQDLEDAERFEASMRLAEVLRTKLDDASGAESAYATALEVEPSNERALVAMDELLTEREAWPELSGVLVRLREVVFSPPELAALTFRHARLYEEQLFDSAAAIDSLQDVLEIDPTHTEAMERLLSLFERSERWSDLYDALERKSDYQTDEEQRAAVLEEMAGLATNRLDRVDDAIDLWRRVAESRGLRDWASLQQLAGLYRQTEQTNELANTLDRLVEIAPDDITRAELLQESGYIWAELLDNQGMAIDRYVRILELIEDEPNALVSLRYLYERTAQYEKYVSTVERLLSLSLIEQSEQPAVFEQVAEIQTDILVDHDKAIVSWNRLLEVAPGNLNALERLDQLHSQRSEWRPLVDVLEQRLQTLDNDADRIDVLKRVAGIWQHEIKETEPAIEAYNRVLDLDLFDFDAGPAYEQLLTGMERWDELVGYYLDRADGLTDEFERRSERQKAAALYEHKLERPESAFLVMVSAGQEDPLDEELHAEMVRLAEVSGQHAVLAESFSRMLAAVSDDPEVDQAALVPLLLAIGQTQNDSLGRPEMAEPYYSRALELEPENERALAALESIYERTDDPEMLVGILKRRATLAYDAREQTALYNRIGSIYRDALQNLEEATEAFKMAVRIDDTDATALDALEAIYSSTSQWRALIEILELKASSVFDTAPLRELRFRIATTWHEALDNGDRAIEAYKDVLGVVPDDVPSLEALEKLYATGEKWERYLDVMDQRLNLSADTAQRAEFLFKQAKVYESAMDDIDRAVDCLNTVLGENPASLPAIEDLERLYNENDRPADLVEVYERHVAALDDNDQKAAVLASMGRTWSEDLGDVYRAAETYQRILQINPSHLIALERLGLLYEEIGDAPNAIEMYERLSEASPVQSIQAEKLFRAGELHEGERGDLETATTRYMRVLEIDATFVPAMQAMQRVYMASERWVDAIEMIERQFDFNRDLASRAMLLVSIGAINEDHLANQPAAQRRYEEALELDPSNFYAAEPLSRMFYGAGEWERARSTLELLVNSGEFEKDDATMSELCTRLGRVNEELASDDEAQRWYEKARQLPVGSPEALQGLARILRRAGSLQEAYALNLEIVSSYRSTLTTEMYAELYYQCGDIKAELGEVNDARSLFEQVLEIEPRHMASLKRLVQLCEENDDQARLAEVRQRLFEVTDDPTLRLTLITQVGDAWLAAGDVAQAEKAFREAVRLDPDSKLVLNKLLNVFVAGEKWERACEVLGKLSQVETDSTRQSQYFFTIGSLFRDQMGKPSEALEFFNKALDINPMNLAPFEAIDKLVTEARDWNTQQREYRKMLARVVSVESEEAVNLRFVLLKNLGEIYRTRMQDMPRAIDSYRAAFSMNPDDEQVANVLAELYERTGDNGPEVIELHQRLIGLSLSRFDSYHALFKAFLSTREFDKAWCVSAALTLFSKQTPEQEAYYKRYLTPQVQQARRSVSEALWTKLVHPDADAEISRIFATIANGIRDDYAQDFKRWQVNKRRDKIDPTQPMPLTAMLRYSFERIGVAPMAIYATQAYPGLYNANLDPPGLVAGPDMLAGKTERELAFICSKTVALCRPEYYLGSGFNTTDSLKIFFYAAIALVTGNVLGDAPVDVVRGYVDALMRMPEPVLAQLRNQVTTYLNQGRNPDLSAWLRGIDHTASRVGLLFSGDVRTAAECIRNEPAPVGKEKQKDRLVELVKFSLSDDYFTLRKELGLALQA
jgi:tetratricopeptide (TPR) repeat protein